MDADLPGNLPTGEPSAHPGDGLRTFVHACMCRIFPLRRQAACVRIPKDEDAPRPAAGVTQEISYGSPKA